MKKFYNEKYQKVGCFYLCVVMLYRCTTKVPKGIKNFIRKCKVDTAGRLIKYHFDGYDCSARCYQKYLQKRTASPLISDRNATAPACHKFYCFSTQTGEVDCHYIFMGQPSPFCLLLLVMSTTGKCISLYDISYYCSLDPKTIIPRITQIHSNTEFSRPGLI